MYTRQFLQVMQPYTLIRSSRRTLALHISDQGELIVRAPRLYPEWLIRDFVAKKDLWIKKHIQRIHEGGGKRLDLTKREIQEMKRILKAYIITRTEELWSASSLPAYTGIKITQSEKRWGSCSGKNGLCFSYRLATYLPGYSGKDGSQGNGDPTRFIDAVIIHELAHLREKNHQKPFWDLVYSLMPEYESIMRKYRNFSRTLGE